MNNIEQDIAKALETEPECEFTTSDNELFQRATATANNQQATKDLVALGMASIWVVFISIFMKILKPAFKQMEAKRTTSLATTKTITPNKNTSKDRNE